MSIIKIPESELEVMEAVWNSQNPISSKQIVGIIEKKKGWKNTTILTLLSRLAKKKFITAAKGKRRTYYTTLVTEEEYRKFETREFFRKFHKGSLKSFITTLHEDNDITDDDLDELDHWIKSR